mmetsp:Transcript_1276/g.2680  ORF Transcript_1276/g.2680 Transcript_1276/m.2680 type:complete len:208 (-) Transcript_1276:11-634(-)
MRPEYDDVDDDDGGGPNPLPLAIAFLAPSARDPRMSPSRMEGSADERVFCDGVPRDDVATDTVVGSSDGVRIEDSDDDVSAFLSRTSSQASFVPCFGTEGASSPFMFEDEIEGRTILARLNSRWSSAPLSLVAVVVSGAADAAAVGPAGGAALVSLGSSPRSPASTSFVSFVDVLAGMEAATVTGVEDGMFSSSVRSFTLDGGLMDR